MKQNRPLKNELNPPPIAIDEKSVEVLRAWFSPEIGQQVSLKTTWQDPGAWGIFLVDIIRHLANAYEREGYDREAVITRIKELFDAEWERPTDEAKDLSDQIH